LLLNKDQEKIVQGSSLFKPYYKQYQKWRDDSVSVAENILKKNKDVLFLNLDIRDYFHSVRIPIEDLTPSAKYAPLQHKYNLKKVFLQIHILYTKLVSKQYKIPYDFYPGLKKNKSQELLEVVLPIGLLSSYILANDYLKEFDTRVIQKINPAYYGRYVDDILIVIEEPQTDYNEKELNDEFKFSFKKYRSNINRSKTSEQVSFDEKELSKLEKFVLENFSPLIKLIDSPPFLIETDSIKSSKKHKSFKLSGYDSLYCQSDKSLLYYFEHEESNLVIDKLKKEINERTSEFRDFPDDDQNEETFEDSAYHLQYQGSEGKIGTLKDYKENRYGLTVYLANKIFTALRHESSISENEKDQVLKFFRGSNCIKFYRLWEKIFTFFLVNKQAEAYITFYLHCVQQIQNIKSENININTNVLKTLFEYLDSAHELTLSLNPQFLSKNKNASRHFEFKINQIKNDLPGLLLNFEPTDSNSFWLVRFRETNLIRHSYVVHPLLNYTKQAKNKNTDLTSLEISFNKFILDDELILNSPRPVKYWECCLSICFTSFQKFQKNGSKNDDGYLITNLLGITKKEINKSEWDVGKNEKEIEINFYLNDAFELYKKINQNHTPSYVFEDKDFQKQFYKLKIEPVEFDKIRPLDVQEVNVNSKQRLNNPRISFVNTEVQEASIIKSIRGEPNLDLNRYKTLASILKKARNENSDMLLFPEFFIPINLLSSIVRYSEKNDILTVLGLEHVSINNVAFNFVVTVLPIEVNGIQDAVVVLRLKNHYAPVEEYLIDGNHSIIPKPATYRYDIFNWKNIYFSTYYCFELANSLHRSLMKGKIDLLIGVEWNKDTNYYSNIVEGGSRDLHAYVAQVNTSQFGDTRLSQPVESARKDILRLKGGINDAVLTTTLDINVLREFQRKKFSITNSTKEFKPLPPDFSLEDVLKRINNQSIL